MQLVLPIVLFVDGNIASGKSTFVNDFPDRIGDNITVVKLIEPFTQWKQDGAIAHLQKNYGKYNGLFQSYIMASMITQITMALDKYRDSYATTIFVIDRHFASARHVYTPIGTADENETFFIELIFRQYELLLQQTDQFLLYIDTSPAECCKRLKNRGRVHDSQISLEYLEKLHKQYRIWINGVKIMDDNLTLLPNFDKNEIISFVIEKLKK
jgi:deoxyadenosine/deoxycytidine kinase